MGRALGKAQISPLTLITAITAIASFLLAGVTAIGSNRSLTPTTSVTLTILAVLVIGAQVAARHAPRFVLLIALQTFLAVALLRSIPGDTALFQTALTVPLVLQLVIRVPPRLAIIGSALLIFAVSVTPDIETFDANRFLVGLIVESITAVLAVVLVASRERLVDARSQLTEQSNAIDSLTAANESFAERLPEMRRDTAESERLRITRELHDSLGYGLTNVVMLLNASERLVNKSPDKAVEFVGRARDLASSLMDETRDTLYALRSISDDMHANPAMFFDRFCADFETATGIRVECHSGSLTAPLPAMVFHFLLRAVQVAFINALRHSRASHIRLFLSMDEENLSMAVWNRATTPRFEPTIERQGIGLTGLQERLAGFGGALKTRYVADEFSLEVTIPTEGWSE